VLSVHLAQKLLIEHEILLSGGNALIVKTERSHVDSETSQNEPRTRKIGSLDVIVL
jgi:hypothetical protein